MQTPSPTNKARTGTLSIDCLLRIPIARSSGWQECLWGRLQVNGSGELKMRLADYSIRILREPKETALVTEHSRTFHGVSNHPVLDRCPPPFLMRLQWFL
jgi:hypothetical protein